MNLKVGIVRAECYSRIGQVYGLIRSRLRQAGLQFQIRILAQATVPSKASEIFL